MACVDDDATAAWRATEMPVDLRLKVSEVRRELTAYASLSVYEHVMGTCNRDITSTLESRVARTCSSIDRGARRS